jgi:hypothetical protein
MAAMKRADITDEHVIAIVEAMSPSGPGVLDILTAEGVPAKVALAKVLHMSRRRILDYGVSPNRCWLNPRDEWRP